MKIRIFLGIFGLIIGLFCAVQTNGFESSEQILPEKNHQISPSTWNFTTQGIEVNGFPNLVRISKNFPTVIAKKFKEIQCKIHFDNHISNLHLKIQHRELTFFPISFSTIDIIFPFHTFW